MHRYPQLDVWTGVAAVDTDMAARIGRRVPWGIGELLLIAFWGAVSALELWVFSALWTESLLLLWLLGEVVWLPLACFLIVGWAGTSGTRRILRTGTLEEFVSVPFAPGTLLYGMDLRAMRILEAGRWINLFVLVVLCPFHRLTLGLETTGSLAFLLVYSVYSRLCFLPAVEALGGALSRRIVLCGPRYGAAARYLYDAAKVVRYKRILGIALLAALLFAGCNIFFVVFIVYGLFHFSRRITSHIHSEAEYAHWWTAEAREFWRLRPEEESEATPKSLHVPWPNAAHLHERLYCQTREPVRPRWLLGRLDDAERE